MTTPDNVFRRIFLFVKKWGIRFLAIHIVLTLIFAMFWGWDFYIQARAWATPYMAALALVLWMVISRCIQKARKSLDLKDQPPAPATESMK